MSGLLGRALTDEERDQRARWQRSQRRARFVRARVMLLAEPISNASAVARAVGVHPKTVRLVGRRFRAEGLRRVEPKVQSGPTVRFGEKAAESLVAILHERPERGGGARPDLGQVRPHPADLALGARGSS